MWIKNQTALSALDIIRPYILLLQLSNLFINNKYEWSDSPIVIIIANTLESVFGNTAVWALWHLTIIFFNCFLFNHDIKFYAITS